MLSSNNIHCTISLDLLRFHSGFIHENATAEGCHKKFTNGFILSAGKQLKE